jgi:hypothetical protein
MTKRRRTALALAFAAALGAAGPPSPAAEMAVKAGYLTKFPFYVDWPANPRLADTAPMTLCILGSDPFGRTIDDAVRGKHLDRHPLLLKRLTGADGAEECQVAFVRGSGRDATEAMLRALAGKPVLTVTDGSDGPQRGMIHFVVQDGRVRFLVDRKAAESAGLSLDARLLETARGIRPRR